MQPREWQRVHTLLPFTFLENSVKEYALMLMNTIHYRYCIKVSNSIWLASQGKFTIDKDRKKKKREKCKNSVTDIIDRKRKKREGRWDMPGGNWRQWEERGFSIRVPALCDSLIHDLWQLESDIIGGRPWTPHIHIHAEGFSLKAHK